MEDLRCKRQAIERGEIHTWSRRGRSYQKQNQYIRHVLLQLGLRLLGLRARGERNARNAVVKDLRLTFDSLPAAFCGFKILHLSDIHADGLAGLADSIWQRLCPLEADVCVLTGDYRFDTSGSCHDVYLNMEKILAGVKTRYGIMGVFGNHDSSDMIPEFERMGVKMLMNASLQLTHGPSRIWFIGVDDPHYYGCDDLPGALLGVPEDAFKILLVHSPEIIEEAAQSGVHLYLCGHTHGGQICLPLIGPLITNANCPRRYAQGVWRYKTVQGYTNAGIGSAGIPVRFFCPPEIGLIELRCSHHPGYCQ
jgi:predicted MPP superfamily phosphohydrolase